MPTPSFESIRDVLQRHLPRAAGGSVVSVDSDGLQVREPGVSIGDLALMLADLTRLGDPAPAEPSEVLPEGLPIAGIRLASLKLERGAAGAHLEFSLRWDDAVLAPFERFELHLGRLDFELQRTLLRARAPVRLLLDQHAFDAVFEWPSCVFTFAFVSPDPATPGAPPPQGVLGSLEARGLVAKGGAPVVRAFVLQGSLLFRSAVLHVELQNLFTLGPVTLAGASADVLLAGADPDASAAAATARLDIDLGSSHAALQIEVDGEVDAFGWRLQGALDALPGTLTLGGLADAFAANTSARLPPAIGNASLTRLAVALDTHDGTVALDAALQWSHQAELAVQLHYQAGILRVAGRLACAGVVFELAFAHAATTVLMGSYDAAGGKPLQLDEILDALSDSQGLHVGLDVKAAAIVIDGQQRLLVAAQVDAGIDLSRLGELPLVGSLLPKAEPFGLTLDPYYMSSGFDARALAAAPPLPPAITLPASPVAGAHVTATLHLGGAPKRDPVPPANSAAPAAAPAVAAPAAAAAPGALSWSDVHKALGPLRIERVGYAITDDAAGGKLVDLAFDASLEVAGLSVTVNGLGARYALNTRMLSPHLLGLGVQLQRGDLTVGGAFLNADGDFAGKLVIGTPKFALNATGAFMMLNGTPSLFGYVAIDTPIGGPAFFFVEGLAAGFGLHRRLHAPPIDAIETFPLIADAGKPPPPKVVPGDELRKLHEVVSPELGEYFLAVGVKFNSFRLLHGHALLVVSVGKDFEIDLIGTADFVSPPDLPASMPALARVRLDLLARIVPREGLVAVEARLDPLSYVYGPLCHLSGGFAFYAWTAGALRGDFVLSVGGYHPQYQDRKPAHYPAVPRVELSYQVTPEVYLKGDAYFALTPSTMMAGGGLHAQLVDGSLHAWADFTVDFWIDWEPYHYDAQLHIGIGAEWKCFHTSAAADLHVWGPDFSGTAHVQWCVFSFDFAFGPQSALAPRPITMQKFKQSFLGVDGTQASQDATVGIVVSGGLIGEVEAKAASGANPVRIPIVVPALLAITTSSRVPVATATLGGRTVATVPAPIGVLPAWVKAVDASMHEVIIERETEDASGKLTWTAVDGEFTAESTDSGFPSALWGGYGTVDQNSPPINATNGLALRPATPVTPGAGHDLTVGALQYDDSVFAVRRSITMWQRQTPVVEPTVLPLTELAALGLDTTGLEWAVPPGERARIDMLTATMES